MIESLAAHLTDVAADGARLEHAARYLVAHWAEHTPPEEMTEALLAAGIEPADLQQALTTLENSPEALETAALEILNVGWNTPQLHEATLASIQEAGRRLPVVELAVVSISVLYGLWLATTGGRKETTRTVRHHADGTYEETETTQWYDPTGPLGAIVDLLRTPGALENAPRHDPPPLPGPSTEPGTEPESSED